MKNVIRILALLAPSWVAIAAPPHHSPYAGEEARDIKALSPNEISDYLAGKGMGYAKAAELNHYPGPKHVLELASALKLTAEQRKSIDAISARMESDAVSLGKKIVEQERQLDRAFAEASVTEKDLQQRLRELGQLQGELRFTHLKAHLATRAAMSPEQIKNYDALRGYGGKKNSHAKNPQRHQH